MHTHLTSAHCRHLKPLGQSAGNPIHLQGTVSFVKPCGITYTMFKASMSNQRL
jgi:hypothetical protein